MPTNYTDDLRLAHVLADDADSTSTSRFQAMDLRVDTKPDLSPVTDADRAVEEGIRRTLSRARPRDAVVGEERLKEILMLAQGSPDAIEEMIEEVLGTEWDNELEAFRYAGDGAPVRWLHQVG